MRSPILFAVTILLSFNIAAQECFEEFNYFRTLNISPPEGLDAIASGTFAIPFNTRSLVDQDKLSPDASDLRIVQSDCSPVPFFIEGVAERDSNIIYVALPEIPTAGLDLHMYYGSDEAQVSTMNGGDVFLFFDDFEDGEVDNDAWEIIGSSNDILIEEEGEMKFTGSSGNGGVFKYVTTTNDYSGKTFDFTALSSNTQIYGVASSEGLNRIALRYSNGGFSNDTLDIYAFLSDTINGGSSTGVPYPFVKVPRYQMNLISISSHLDESDHLVFTRFQNFSLRYSNLDSTSTGALDFESQRPFFSSFSEATRVGFVGIRDTPEALPNTEIGEEQALSTTGLFEAIQMKEVAIYPNPAHDVLYLEIDSDVSALVEIRDPRGRLVLNEVYRGSIDISGLPAGHYTATIFIEGRAIQSGLLMKK